MTSHELGKILLAGDDLPVGVCFTNVNCFIDNIVEVETGTVCEESVLVIIIDIDEPTVSDTI